MLEVDVKDRCDRPEWILNGVHGLASKGLTCAFEGAGSLPLKGRLYVEKLPESVGQMRALQDMLREASRTEHVYFQSWHKTANPAIEAPNFIGFSISPSGSARLEEALGKMSVFKDLHDAGVVQIDFGGVSQPLKGYSFENMAQTEKATERARAENNRRHMLQNAWLHHSTGIIQDNSVGSIHDRVVIYDEDPGDCYMYSRPAPVYVAYERDA